MCSFVSTSYKNIAIAPLKIPQTSKTSTIWRVRYWWRGWVQVRPVGWASAPCPVSWASAWRSTCPSHPRRHAPRGSGTAPPRGFLGRWSRRRTRCARAPRWPCWRPAWKRTSAARLHPNPQVQLLGTGGEKKSKLNTVEFLKITEGYGGTHQNLWFLNFDPTFKYHKWYPYIWSCQTSRPRPKKHPSIIAPSMIPMAIPPRPICRQRRGKAGANLVPPNKRLDPHRFGCGANPEWSSPRQCPGGVP